MLKRIIDQHCALFMVLNLYIIASPLFLMSGYGFSQTGNGHPVVISESAYDVDHDGVKEIIQIVLEQGRRYRDVEPWCGKGEKWEGQFTIRLIKGSRAVTRQSLNELLMPDGEAEDIFLWTPRFSLVFNDYNGDGKIDFNLGQYGNCNGNSYQLFTIDANGTVTKLPIAERRGFFVSEKNRSNSTNAIRIVNGGLEFTYYDNTAGKNVSPRYIWNGHEFEQAVGQKQVK
jgi:hypothetical protein